MKIVLLCSFYVYTVGVLDFIQSYSLKNVAKFAQNNVFLVHPAVTGWLSLNMQEKQDMKIKNILEQLDWFRINLICSIFLSTSLALQWIVKRVMSNFSHIWRIWSSGMTVRNLFVQPIWLEIFVEVVWWVISIGLEKKYGLLPTCILYFRDCCFLGGFYLKSLGHLLGAFFLGCIT